MIHERVDYMHLSLHWMIHEACVFLMHNYVHLSILILQLSVVSNKGTDAFHLSILVFCSGLEHLHRMMYFGDPSKFGENFDKNSNIVCSKVSSKKIIATVVLHSWSTTVVVIFFEETLEHTMLEFSSKFSPNLEESPKYIIRCGCSFELWKIKV